MRRVLLSALVLALASLFACEAANDGGETPVEGVARKVEQAGEALREASADGSLLVQSPAPLDAGE